MVHGTAIAWLSVNDIQRSLSFYRDTLGLNEAHNGENWAVLDGAEGLRIGLSATGMPGRGGAVIALHPRSSLDDAIEKLRGSGVEIAAEISEHPWGRVATLNDPDGNRLQLCATLTASRSSSSSREPRSDADVSKSGSDSQIRPNARDRRTMAMNLNSFLHRSY